MEVVEVTARKERMLLSRSIKDSLIKQETLK